MFFGERQFGGIILLTSFFSGGSVVKLSPSAHADTFCRDNLPPAEQWPMLRFDLPELQYPERVNCATTLLDEVTAAYGPDRLCLLTAVDSWTYGELLTRANQAAHVLTEDFGLVPGQRVLLRGPNKPWLVASWFGVLKAGGVVVATMPMLRSAELAPLAGLTRPAVGSSTPWSSIRTWLSAPWSASPTRTGA
jgi:2-aminobenzoate-CoA ligase